MKRCYADLHCFAASSDLKEAAQLISKAAELGYHLVGVPFLPSSSEEEIDKVRKFCGEWGLDLASRVDLRPKTSSELTRSLRKLRRKFEVVAALCDSKNVARQAAKDRRVDLLSFPSTDPRRRFFDLAEAELASNALASLEVDMKPLLTLEGPARVRLLACLRKEASVARHFGVPIVVSSGASDRWLLRKPLEVAALAGLFDMTREEALNAVSSNPLNMVSRNRAKLSPRFVAPGIRVIRKGKDC